MHFRSLVSFLAASSALLSASSALAQAPAERPAPSAECFPHCRTGFLCHAGQCISACNPPCPASERCNATGECTPTLSPTPPLSPAPAPAPAPARNAHTHDGFMLRLAFGIGDAEAWRSAGGFDATYSGLAGTFSADVGGAPIDNVVVLLRLAHFGLWKADLDVDRDDVSTAGKHTVGAFLIAPGVSYYLMPLNVHGTLAAGISWLDVDSAALERRDNGGTDAGVGVNFELGKEFWVEDQVGLGLGLRFWYTRLTSDGVQLSFTGIGLLVSSTFQ